MNNNTLSSSTHYFYAYVVDIPHDRLVAFTDVADRDDYVVDTDGASAVDDSSTIAPDIRRRFEGQHLYASSPLVSGGPAHFSCDGDRQVFIDQYKGFAVDAEQIDRDYRAQFEGGE